MGWGCWVAGVAPVADVGCGNGKNLCGLCPGSLIVGCDRSANMAAICAGPPCGLRPFLPESGSQCARLRHL